MLLLVYGFSSMSLGVTLLLCSLSRTIVVSFPLGPMSYLVSGQYDSIVKTPQTYSIDHAEINPVLSWRLHSSWAASIVLKCVLYATIEEKQPSVSPSHKP